MLAGQPAKAVGFGPLGAAYGGALPSDLDGSILPPSGAPNYFGAIDTNVSPSGNTFQVWKFHVDFATPANSTFGTASNTPDFNLPVDTYFWNMCSGFRSCIPQPGTSQGLDAIGDRLMNRLQYRHFSDGHESLVANHTVGVGSSNNQAAIRWYEIRNLSTVPTIYQQGTYAPSGDSRWMGSMAMDQAGDIALGYSVSSGTISPSIRYTGRLAGDPLGTLPQGEATLIAGSGSQTSSFNRWGDYSMMAVDPTDDCTFWYTQEYYALTSTAAWQTRVGSFKFPNCSPSYVAAAVGTDGALWVLHSGSSRLVSEFGVLIGAPAVVALRLSSGSIIPLYIGTGSDNNLWVRDDMLGWQPLIDSPVSCIDNPAAAVVSGTLYVACQGSDHALWHVEGTAPTTDSLPRLSHNGFKSFGGVLAAGPAIASIAGTPTYFVVGADTDIYSRTVTSNYSGYPWKCIGHPSVATYSTTSYFACHGTDGALWYSSNSGLGWSAAQPLSGGLTDGTGVAATPSGPLFFVQGTDNAIWHRTIEGSWKVDGGIVQFGLAATAL
jgi:hypothetical protein